MRMGTSLSAFWGLYWSVLALILLEAVLTYDIDA